MEQIVAHLIQYGLLVVFANVFLEQIGVPIPALPTLVVAGALAARGRMDPMALLAVALAASVLADTIWYYIGRWQGHRVLRTVCKLSLSPDSCVRGTEDLFERAGMPSLLYAKFIPGYNTIAPPLAGAMDKTLGSFVFWDSLGSLLWIGSGVVVGFLFHRAVGRALHYLETLGYWAGGVLAMGLALVVLAKWWQRKRVSKLLKLARISVAELKEMMTEGQAPVIVDVRNRSAHLHDPRRIPGALRVTVDEIGEKLGHLPRDREIVVYCT
ncbi:MAG TPA: VTT domain-containing protein [Thermoanaerobaculia bacterium]|jgi:membrane protein DedA with SNARE-associated domain|nr:VTT domain-containing protein [Thermoanaerobaculia bacterium]